MSQPQVQTRRRFLVALNYLSLILMNVCFYFVVRSRGASHLVDAAGLLALALVIVTFIQGHLKSGLWKLTHTKGDRLDERELGITHYALGLAYNWFTVICLSILLTHAVVFSLVPDLDFGITMPLVVSLIYLAHTLPGSILAWTQREVLDDAS